MKVGINHSFVINLEGAAASMGISEDTAFETYFDGNCLVIMPVDEEEIPFSCPICEFNQEGNCE